MSAQLPDARAQAAILELRRNRAELLTAFGPPVAREAGEFPRSATFRWLTTHVNARSLATTALTAAVLRPPWLQLISMFVFNKNRRKA